ncbi:MAG: hypothetical protein JW889_00160 [Verrucomicrobia bacterium]|nr:hypothetical protein [Verrucomicrobiota bacterium]
MKQITLLCLGVLMAAAAGCGQDKTSNVQATPADPPVAKGLEVLSPSDQSVVLIDGIDRPGRLVATLRWPGSDSRVTAFFRNGTPDNRGWLKARSPMTTTTVVTQADVDDGAGWTLNIENSSCCRLVMVRYTVKFVPDEAPATGESVAMAGGAIASPGKALALR